MSSALQNLMTPSVIADTQARRASAYTYGTGKKNSATWTRYRKLHAAILSVVLRILIKIRLKEFCAVALDRHIAILSDAGGKWQGEEGIVREPGSATIGDSYYQACRSPRVCGRLRPRSGYV